MKKTLISILFAAALSAPAFSVDYLAGVKTGYYVWDPFFQEMIGAGLSDVKSGSGMLYGPVLSIIITPEINFSFSGLYGIQSTHWFSENGIQTWPGNPDEVYVSGTYYAEMERIDLDSALSYKVADNFKLFAGYKFQRAVTVFKYAERRYGIAPSTEHVYIEGDLRTEFPSHGPAIGIGVSSPIGSSFFASANLSALYMWSEMKITKNQLRSYNIDSGDLDYASSTLTNEPDAAYDLRQMGINFEPTIGAVIGDSGVVCTLGGRMQYTRLKFKDSWEGDPGNWMTDMLYGVYFSVLYSF